MESFTLPTTPHQTEIDLLCARLARDRAQMLDHWLERHLTRVAPEIAAHVRSGNLAVAEEELKKRGFHYGITVDGNGEEIWELKQSDNVIARAKVVIFNRTPAHPPHAPFAAFQSGLT